MVYLVRGDQAKNYIDRGKGRIRAGVIPVILDPDGTPHFIFAVDHDSGDFTDFGGGMNFGEQDPVQSARRELFEESYGYLDLPMERLSHAAALVDARNVILFPLFQFGTINPPALDRHVKASAVQRVKRGEIAETRSVAWMNPLQLKRSLEAQKIYTVPARLLNSISVPDLITEVLKKE